LLFTLLKKILLAAILLLALVISLFFTLLDQKTNKPINLSVPTLITVSAGESLSSLSKELVNRGWITKRFWLRSYARLYPKESQIKAGTYLVPAKISLVSLLDLLVSGKEHQFSLTFIEGTNFKQWLGLLAKEQQLKHIITDQTPAQIADLIGIKHHNPEGWFFPETYAFTAGTTDLAILKRAHKQMKIHLIQAWQQRSLSLPYDKPYQALIMASIIEKESSLNRELPLISAVFVNRLMKKMRLQTDPTVIYGLGERYQGNITRRHLREKTAYNTYRINGLPPTPIAMPGLGAIEAVMHPASSDYLYFVSMGNGAHIFSETLAEHNKAVAKYQLN